MNVCVCVSVSAHVCACGCELMCAHILQAVQCQEVLSSWDSRACRVVYSCPTAKVCVCMYVCVCVCV